MTQRIAVSHGADSCTQCLSLVFFSYETNTTRLWVIFIRLYKIDFVKRILHHDIRSAVSGLSESALLADYSAWKDQRVRKVQDSPQPTLCTFNYSSYPCLLSAGAKKRILLEEVKQRQFLAQHFALATAQLTGQSKAMLRYTVLTLRCYASAAQWGISHDIISAYHVLTLYSVRIPYSIKLLLRWRYMTVHVHGVYHLSRNPLILFICLPHARSFDPPILRNADRPRENTANDFISNNGWVRRRAY